MKYFLSILFLIFSLQIANCLEYDFDNYNPLLPYGFEQVQSTQSYANGIQVAIDTNTLRTDLNIEIINRIAEDNLISDATGQLALELQNEISSLYYNIGGDTLEGEMDADSNNIVNAGSMTFTTDGMKIYSDGNSIQQSTTTFNGQIDINLDGINQMISITQTHDNSINNQALIYVNDDRTKTYANPKEATFYADVYQNLAYGFATTRDIYANGAVRAYTFNPANSIAMMDYASLYLGSSNDSWIRWGPWGTAHSARWVVKVNNAGYSGNIDILEGGEFANSLNHGLQANPTLNIWNDGATGCLRMTSDGDFGVMTVYERSAGVEGVKIDTHTYVGDGGGFYPDWVDPLPSSGYDAGAVVVSTTTGYVLYISTEKVTSVNSWQKVADQ